jgi:predicted amidohydrolase
MNILLDIISYKKGLLTRSPLDWNDVVARDHGLASLGLEMLVEANIIKTIGSDLEVSAGATVIDGAERTLMPGLIDNHVHLMLPGPRLPAKEANSTWEDIAIHGVAQDVSDAGHHDGT